VSTHYEGKSLHSSREKIAPPDPRTRLISSRTRVQRYTAARGCQGERWRGRWSMTRVYSELVSWTHPLHSPHCTPTHNTQRGPPRAQCTRDPPRRGRLSTLMAWVSSAACCVSDLEAASSAADTSARLLDAAANPSRLPDNLRLNGLSVRTIAGNSASHYAGQRRRAPAVLGVRLAAGQ